MRYLFVLALVASASCAGASRSEVAPQPLNPVGTWDFTADFEGQEIAGTLEITGSPGAFAGSVQTDIGPDAPLSSVTIEGQIVTLIAETPDGPAVLELTVEGDTFGGTWALGAAGGTLRGTRRRPS
jgi:hypothetical protein